MTITSATIALMSPFAVSDAAGSKFTTAEYNYLAAAAKKRLDRESPGLDATEYDHAHALLICHMHEVRLGSTGLKSESIGDYSYTRDAGTTTYLLDYLQIVEGAAAHAGSNEDSEHVDAEMDGFKLDQSNVGGPSQ
jgi:hypothetical protein